MDCQFSLQDTLKRYIPDQEIVRMVLAQIQGQGDRGPARRAAPRGIDLTSIHEPRPGAKLRAHYRRHWPAYRDWYLREGADARPSLEEARAELAHHMPEMLSIWSAIVAAVGADELGARMLTMYDPPPLVSGCSQAVITTEPLLVRNYDYDVNLFDGVLMATQYNDSKIVGMTDQLWGLLDGMNDAGLAASFTFGGRRERQRGFSVPIVTRYVLETCTTVDEGVDVLRRIPLQCAYNVTLLDRSGNHATVWLTPGREARVTSQPACTNHQGSVGWREHAQWTRTVQRLDHLDALLLDACEPERLIDEMLSPPLRATRYEEGFGTLYTAAYRPKAGVVEYRWPDATWRQSLQTFREERFAVNLGEEPAHSPMR